MNNVETIQQHLNAIATAHADFAKTSLEQGKAYAEQLVEAKSLDKAVELHSQYANTAYETLMVEAYKISNLYKEFTKEFARESFAPLAAVLAAKSAA